MRSVLVTGGTKRLGAEIAARLRERGWKVIVSSHRAEAGADIVADLSGGVHEAERLFAEAERLAGGHLDGVVNNAALFTGEEKAMMEVNVAAPCSIMRMMSAKGGSVVNILDTRILKRRDGGLDAYSLSKAALLDETLRFARDFAPALRVNGVAPGPVLAPEGVHEKAGRLLVARPSPADVASAVAFLLETPSVTGAVIPVDGGQHLL